jgi:hypothetical protein
LKRVKRIRTQFVEDGITATRVKSALVVAAALACRWLCAGQSIPDWFPKVPPVPAPRGQVLRVAMVEELLSAIDRLSGDGTILLANGRYQLSRPVVFDYKTNIVLHSASGSRSDLDRRCGQSQQSGQKLLRTYYRSGSLREAAIGKYAGIKESIRFKARYAGQVDAARVYFMVNSTPGHLDFSTSAM